MTIDPPPSAWPERMATWIARRNDARATKFRAELGLPTGQPIIMTGHQPMLWHAGVLAKFIACQAGARALGAAAAWIIPDQDESDPFALRVPVLDDSDRLHARVIRLAPQPQTGFPAASQSPSAIVSPAIADGALESVRTGAARIGAALAAYADAPSAARQGALAAQDLLQGIVSPAPTIFATDLSKTALFGELVDRMVVEPASAVRAYNDAAEALPQAGVGRLIANPARERFELPLWRQRMGEPRRRVYAHEVADIPREELAPRALCMTALVRLAGCDCFIHGTGGAAYDAVTEQWITAWLGEPLAPIAVVTATLRLPLRKELPTAEAAARARWLAHHARHDPAAVGDVEADAAKQAALDRVRAARERGEDPSVPYQDMQRALRDYRSAQHDRLDALRRDADLAEARLAERDVVADRTWAFPLHSHDAIDDLQRAITAQFDGTQRDATSSDSGARSVSSTGQA